MSVVPGKVTLALRAALTDERELGEQLGRQQGRKEGRREGDIRTLEHVATKINVIGMSTDPEREFEVDDFSQATFDFLHKMDVETYADLLQKEVSELLDLCKGESSMVVEIIFALADRGLRVKASMVESA